MTAAALNDLSAMAAFGLLLGTACAAAGYLVGKRHGYEIGEIAGSNTERQAATRRVMQAKRDGTRAGRILGMREAIREMLPFSISRKQTQPTENLEKK